MDRRQRLNLFLIHSLERLRADFRGNLETVDTPLLASLHIPKTGGTSFRIILREIFGRHLVHDYGPNSLMSSPEIRQGQPLQPGVRCIHGHFRGLRYENKEPDAVFIYWLRHAAARVISLFEMRRRNLNRSHPEYIRVYTGEMDLLEFAGLPAQREQYVHFLKGIPQERGFFTGILEQFGDGLLRFYQKLELKSYPKYRHRNKNRHKSVVDPAEREQIIALNQQDLAVYRRTLKRWEQGK